MPNELDNRFKTALDGLPDAPPPGTAFDADALWTEMDRQLRPRRRFRAGWLAAACGLLTLLAGLGWWFSGAEAPTAPERPVAGRLQPMGKRQESPKREVFTNTPVARRAVSPPGRATSQRGTTPPLPTVPTAPEAERLPVLPESIPTAAPELEIAAQPAPEPVVASAKPGLSAKKTAYSRPRFRVVHANELPSNETIPTKQPRADATARVTLGFPSALQPASAETPQVLMLTRKQD